MSGALRSKLASGTILVVDALELRRSGIVSFLRPWADGSKIDLVQIHPSGALSRPDCPSTRLVLLVIGSQSVANPERSEWLRALQAKYATAPLVLIAERDHPQEVIAAFNCGVRGYIAMSSAPQFAIETIKFILGGGSFFPPTAFFQNATIQATASSGTAAATIQAEAQSYGLTERQQQVLERLRRGDSNKLIAKQLNVGVATVKIHVRQVMRKLGVRNRTQAALSVGLLVSKREQDRG
jgi:DNA-binding NarL/FixJ family response regulator